MTTLSMAVVLQAAVIATGAEDYATAHAAITETGTPMVVMVGADWCPACQTMKRSILPRVRKLGLLRKVAFAVVNLDRDQELGQELTHGGPIPQLIMYRKTSDGWRRKALVGSQDVQTVETFINEGVQLDEDAKHAQPASQTQESGKAEPQPQRSASHDPDGQSRQAS